MKLKRMGIIEILKRIWLLSENKIRSSESVSKQPTQLIFELNSSLRQKLGTLELVTDSQLEEVQMKPPFVPNFCRNDELSSTMS